MTAPVTVVLVHGAWQGAWCWERLTPLLAEEGVEAVTPTLTGSGARAAEMSPEVTLATHIEDVEHCVDELDGDLILVGHSYSGTVISGVAAVRSERLRAAVYVDAFSPRPGDSAMDLLPAPFPDRFNALACEQGGGWRLPADDGMLDIWGLDDPADRDWVRARLTDWSINCFRSPCAAPDLATLGMRHWYVGGTKDCPSRAAFAPMARRAEAAGATVVGAPTGHDVMIEAPEVLAGVLTAAAS